MRRKSIISILISSYNRLKLFKRTLFSIVKNKPLFPFELVIADDGSTQDILSELHQFDKLLRWKFIKVDTEEFTKRTGLVKFHNNPALTNNIAFKHSEGEYIFTMGNEVIAYANAFNQMLDTVSTLKHNNYLILSKTYDVPQEVLNELDEYGSNLTEPMVWYCRKWPLADQDYKSDVTNYLSLTSRQVWLDIKGYDERYCGGIACEDSDWVRRFRTLPNAEIIRCNSISLHQFHGGRTRYYSPVERGMNETKWDEGLQKNRKIYHEWNGQTKNPQAWEYGLYGVKEVITNG